MVNYKWNPYLCMIMMPILGGLVGLVNGILVTRVKLNAWLVTLSMKLALVGIVVKLTKVQLRLICLRKCYSSVILKYLVCPAL